ncbi:hypothetical protein GF337_15245 [candidate division KSB1 bacterium]|nr:hypothetical protein [candidate division KSB1 bacterium]
MTLFHIKKEAVMNYIENLTTPQIKKIHSGKVRESFRIDPNTRMIVATDRVSAFDQVLKTPIPGKGAVLNGIASFWFEKTRDIIDNHLIEVIDPNISLVREATPIRIEMIVRAYLTGSMWRNYSKGKREFSGIKVGDNLKKHRRFPELLLTPTTKEESDREISPKEIIDQGWVDADIYEQMESISLQLFKRAEEYLEKRNLILVDTKYEFGLVDDKLVLIDEIHTPDSSRFWMADNYNKDPENAIQMDKEVVRAYLLQNKVNDHYRDELPQEIVHEAATRYNQIFEMITGEAPSFDISNVKNRIYQNLVRRELMKEGYVVIVMGSSADVEHCEKMKKVVEKYDIFSEMRVMSAHKNGEDIIANMAEYDNSVEPGAVIAVAGLSNGLGGALGANLSLPVINCPPFKDQTDIMVNVNSSLMMPSKTPAATVVKPESAALVALRSLNVQRLRDTFRKEVQEVKSKLREDDKKIRGM